LIDVALKHYGAQAADCYMLGDSAGDIEAGQSAGCCPVLIGREDAPGAQQAGSFSDAVQWILAREAKRTNRRGVSDHCERSGEELP
jgi:phosphoglycolate phosphatase-like HAD superfamily hydrolase